MTANNVKIAFYLFIGVNIDIIKNMLWKHHHQQQLQQENINQQQERQNINQFTSPLPIPASQKHHLEMRAVKYKKTVSSTNRRRRRKQFYIKQLLFPGVKKKCQTTSSRACLASSHPLQKLIVVLMWSCLLS